MSRFTVGALLTLALATSPSAAGAQQQAEQQEACGNMWNGCGWFGVGHEVPGPGSQWKFPHVACDPCYIGGAYYSGEHCHGPCNDDFLDQQVNQAALRGDLRTLTTLAVLAPGRIAWNFARASLQIRDCGGAIIANLPLGAIEATYVTAMFRLQDGAISRFTLARSGPPRSWNTQKG